METESQENFANLYRVLKKEDSNQSWMGDGRGAILNVGDTWGHLSDFDFTAYSYRISSEPYNNPMRKFSHPTDMEPGP